MSGRSEKGRVREDEAGGGQITWGLVGHRRDVSSKQGAGSS